MKIICIGRNYHEHVKEMNSPETGVPVFFLKPETALLLSNRPFYYPEYSKEIHYETELVIRINRNGKHIHEAFAQGYYDEIGIGLDLTARDLQRNCRKLGLPWEIAKGFDFSAPISHFMPIADLPNRENIAFSLHKNGIEVQTGQSEDMIFSFNKIIEHVSQYITLKMGDIIFTGTPAGVGPIEIGDRLEAYIENKKLLTMLVK